MTNTAPVHTIKDPVCGAEIEDIESALTENYEMHDYFFCSQECLDKFNEHPEEYSGEGLMPGMNYPMGVTPRS